MPCVRHPWTGVSERIYIMKKLRSRAGVRKGIAALRENKKKSRRGSIRSITDTALFLMDGTCIELNQHDIDLLRFSFPDTCEKCGHDPKEVIYNGNLLDR